MNFSNKVVLITGGSAGIGAATAEQFAKQGANIAIVGRNETRLKEVAKKCKLNGVDTLVIKADISKADDVKTVIPQVIEKFGKLDILINNAGVYKPVSLYSSKILEVYDEVMNTNLRATVQMTNLAAPFLKKTSGNIVNISSILGKTLCRLTESGIYGASKAGLNQFTRAAALELAPEGVRVNLVSPGPVRTEMLNSVNPSMQQDDFKVMTAMNQVSDPVDIAEVIVFLASDKAKSVTGSNYTVDCGSLLKM